MSQQPSSTPVPSPAAPTDVSVVEPSFEVQIHSFWEKNRQLIAWLCVAVLLVALARGGWDYYAAGREKDLKAEYAKIADQPDKLAAFADSHAGHPLAGIAYLQVADQKYASAEYGQAGGFYAKAGDNLKNDVLRGRARLGAAMSKLSSGDKAAGEAGLKAISADQALLKEMRAEAAYHLAVLAIDAGNVAEARKQLDEINQIDQGGSWSQRGTMLQAKLAAGNPSADASTPAVLFKP